MRKIQLKDAKANLSAVVNRATRGEPSVITRHGKPEAVVLGIADWERLSRVPSFGRLLMSAPLEPGDLPKRSRARTAYEADDGFPYYIKGDVSGKATRASEWLGTQLAEAVGLAAPAPCIIELQD